MSQTGPLDSRLASAFSLLYLPILAIASGAMLSGCSTLDQFFNKTWIDPSQPSYLKSESARRAIRGSIGIYDPEVGVLPKDASDPLPEDIEVKASDYRVVRGDTLTVQVWELQGPGQETTLTRRVSDSGFIMLPYVNPIFAAGQTERGVELAVAKAYRDAGKLEDPQVAVASQTRVTRMFSVMGPFNSPGMFNIPSPDFRLLDAYTMVGGVADPSIEMIHILRRAHAESPSEQPAEQAPPPANGTRPPPSDNGSAPLDLPGGPTPPAPNQLKNGPPPGTTPDDLKHWTPGGAPAPRPTDLGEPIPAPPARAPVASPPPNSTGQPNSSGQWTDWVIGPDGQWKEIPQPQQGAATPTTAAAATAPPHGGIRVIRIPLASLRNGEARYANVVIRDHDVLVAPQQANGEFYVVGNINRPGVYNLSARRITLTEAIAAAGWFGPLAVPSRVQLIRRISPDEHQMIVVDVGKIMEGKADDYVIKPNDLINVGTSVYAPFLAVIRNAFRASYGVGFVYDRNFADIDSYGSRPNPHN